MMHKVCTSCKAEQPLTLFYKSSKNKDGLQHSCKQCMAGLYRRARQNKVAHYTAVTDRRNRANKQFVDNWKRDRGCAVCSETDPCCLDLHHLDPDTKDAHPSDLVRISIKSFMNEAAKCVVLCANCHRKVHAGVIDL